MNPAPRPPPAAGGPAGARAQAPLPAPAAVQTMLRDLLGVPAVIEKAAAKLPLEGAIVAVYATTEEAPPLAFAICDLAFTCVVGAALSMFPPEVATKAIQAKAPTETLLENFSEVVNIFASLINGLGGPHVRLIRRIVPPAKAPPPIATAIAGCTSRVDLNVTLPRYPKGRIAFLNLGQA